MKKNQIKIYDFDIYNARNLYCHRPVMKMIVDIGKFADTPTNIIPGFNENLLKNFPNLKTNCCSLGYPGGFLERLREGTYLAHVLEHVILEMQYMVGYDVNFGKTRTLEAPSLYSLVYEFKNEVCGLECGKSSVFILNNLLEGKEVKIDGFIDYLKKISLDAELGPSTSAIVNEAKLRDIPVTRIGNESLVRLGYGKHSRLIESTLSDTTSCISVDISCNKQLTKNLLKEHQIPVPYGKVVYTEISAQMVANQIGMPVVIKPFDGNQGKGVHLNLNSIKEIKSAFHDASNYSNGIIVEKYVKGRDFRVLVVNNQVRAVAERIPASIIGDGKHSIKELVAIVNIDPDRGENHEKRLTKIRIDNVAINLLKKNGMTVNTIPLAGETVYLRENGNLSTGGIAIDYTDEIHPDNTDLAIRAAKAIGLDIAGIDFVTDDISKSILDTDGVIVEVNTAPGIRMHLYPSLGKPRNVAKDIVDMLFPSIESTEFPIVSVTGTNGKTTVVRLISHILSLSGKTVGMTSTSGTFIGDKCICKGDNSGPRSAKSILANKEIDAAVLETARGGIVREGLGYNLADVGIITNITEDHLGIDNIDNLEDLAFVKSLVIEAVKKDGAAVLNAEDPLTPYILERVKARTILFHKDEKLLEEYKSFKFIHVYTSNDMIYIKKGDLLTEVITIKDIPITFGGLIDCNIENCLAAVSGLYALGVPIDKIKQGLASFTDNTGRFNQFDLSGIRIMLDYGHNYAGYERVINACKKFSNQRLIGVIGMPGDRMDSAIRSVGKICANAFGRVYIKEDLDLRNRKNGEVARILYESIINNNIPKEKVFIIENELEALKQAISDSRDGDFIVAFYEKLEPLQNYLETKGAIKITNYYPENNYILN